MYYKHILIPKVLKNVHFIQIFHRNYIFTHKRIVERYFLLRTRDNSLKYLTDFAGFRKIMKK